MSRVRALAASFASPAVSDYLRAMIVATCAMALAFAGQPLPL